MTNGHHKLISDGKLSHLDNHASGRSVCAELLRDGGHQINEVLVFQRRSLDRIGMVVVAIHQPLAVESQVTKARTKPPGRISIHHLCACHTKGLENQRLRQSAKIRTTNSLLNQRQNLHSIYMDICRLSI